MVSCGYTLHQAEVQDIIQRGDTLYLLTRSFVYSTPDNPREFHFLRIMLPPPVNYDEKEGLFKTLWVIHSGEIGGFLGKLLVDFIGFIFIFLTITGLIYWLFPKWIKRRKRKEKAIQNILRINRFSWKWHSKTGIWVVAFLLITTMTGMFLRPPLLITIANASVGKIPFTLLHTPNPWYDKLRRILYDETHDIFIIGTNQGIFGADRELKNPLALFQTQPPVSVMGITVFDPAENGSYLVGSFTGLFLWNPFRGILMDVNNPSADLQIVNSGSPLSENLTAGVIILFNNQIIFDYNRGAESMNPEYVFPEMPASIREQSPMSLWNLALEFHTGRYYSVLFGKLYILFIPLFGISLLIVLISGS